MKKVHVVFVCAGIIIIGLVWLVMWGDFAEWRYSKDLHCDSFQNVRQTEICKSLEKYQEYTFTGHAIVSAGYRPTFTTATRAWCELSLTETDLQLLDKLQYELVGHNELSTGASMLFNMLDTKLNPETSAYSGSVLDPTSQAFQECSK